jgi:hypothetical protein
MAYDPKTITLAPGALMLVVTDGVIEAQNAAGEMYGFERLEALLNDLPNDVTAQGVIDAVLAAVREHLGDQEPQDDVTLLALRSLEITVSKTVAVQPPSAQIEDKTGPEPAAPAAEAGVGSETSTSSEQKDEAPTAAASIEPTKGE